MVKIIVDYNTFELVPNEIKNGAIYYVEENEVIDLLIELNNQLIKPTKIHFEYNVEPPIEEN